MEPDISPAAGETIGERLKRLRLERGLSQRELAAPGVSYAYISRIEAGTRQPSVKALRRLASKLGVSADYLETGSDLDPSAARELRLDGPRARGQARRARGGRAGDRGCARRRRRRRGHSAALRARVALAQLALERGEYEAAASRLELALADEVFAPVERFDIYANLGRAYASSGRPDRAAELFQSCIDGVVEAGGDASLEARYATLLSYALTDMGDIGRAEEVVREALARTSDPTDPYMRVRLYWSIARLAHSEGRESVALENVRKAIALLQATDDTFHLARAHILAAGSHSGMTTRTSRGSPREGGAPARHVRHAAGQARHRTASSAVALHRGDPEGCRARAERYRAELGGTVERDLAPRARGRARTRRATSAARSRVRAAVASSRVSPLARRLERCRAWGRLLREQGRETEAMDVLDRAAELGMRVPDGARAER